MALCNGDPRAVSKGDPTPVAAFLYSSPAGPQVCPLFSPPTTGTYPLVNELELEVAAATVWVGLGAGFQGVPLVLTTVQVLGEEGRLGLWLRGPGDSGGNPAAPPTPLNPCLLLLLFQPRLLSLTCSLRTTLPRKSSWPLSLRASLKILLRSP